MARIGIWIPFETEDGAKRGLAKIAPTGLHGDVTRLKEKDRTGPSLRERLATAEERVILMGARMAQFEGHPAEGGTGILERVVLLEARLASLAHDSTDRCHDINGHDERLDSLEAAIGEPVCIGCGGNIGHHHAPDQGGCSGWFPTVREHLARVETEHRAAVDRIGDLEREPAPVRPEPLPTPGSVEEEIDQATELLLTGCVPLWSYPSERGTQIRDGHGLTTAEATQRQAGQFEKRMAAKDAADLAVRPEPGSVAEPTPEQIEAYLRGSAEWWPYDEGEGWIYRRTWFATDSVDAVARAEKRTPAEMRARILAASGAAPADPDRLAKVAHIASLRAQDMRETIPWSPAERAVCRAIAAAVAEACAQDRAELLARAEKAERELTDLRADLASLSAEMGLPPGMRPAEGELTRLFGRGQRAEDMRRGFEIAVEHVRDGELYHSDAATALRDAISELPDGTRPTATLTDAEMAAERYAPVKSRVMTPEEIAAYRGTEPPTEAEMAAELRREGWRHTQRWGWVAPGDGNTTIWTTNEAHAAMRAAKGAR